MKKVRITPSTFFFSCFITLWGEQFLGDEGHIELNAKKSHREKKTETGGTLDDQIHGVTSHKERP